MPAVDMNVELPVPGFYRTENAERWDHGPDQQRLFEAAVAWREQHGLAAAATDDRRVQLLLIDLQKDFCFAEGALFVGGRNGVGAIRDNDRTAQFIYRTLGMVSQVTCTMDTHHPHQIFSPSFWLTEDDAPPAPHREVTADDVRSGRLRPDPALAVDLTGGDYERLRTQVIHYCEQLEASGKYTLYLWPPHCILGSDGHALAGVIHEARMFHAFARAAPSHIEIKGDNPLTENYSALAPEVRSWFDGAPLGQRSSDLLARLHDADAIIVAGQAASHCVKHTLDDLLESADDALHRKVYILRDCMSSVTVPHPERPAELAFDFTPHAEAAFERFADAGMNIVESTTPIREWPSFFDFSPRRGEAGRAALG